MFKKLDADRSGTISTEELSAGLKSQGYNLSDAEVHQLLEEVDVDKSGYIDFDEFMATLIDWSEVQHPTPCFSNKRILCRKLNYSFERFLCREHFGQVSGICLAESNECSCL